MKKLSIKSMYRPLVSASIFGVTLVGVAYAAIITSTTDTVSSGDSITANWYQDVNDKLGGGGDLSLDKLNIGFGVDSGIFSGPSSWLDDGLGNTKLINTDRTAERGDFVDFYVPGNGAANIGAKMSILENGNVGIGTTVPSTKLHVVTPNFRIENENNSVFMGVNSGASWITTNNSIPLTLNTAGVERMRINANGNVGIGTTDPNNKLRIVGNASEFNKGIPAASGTVQNGIMNLQPGKTYGETLDFGMNVQPTYAWLQASNYTNYGIKYPLSLNPNGGNVGIGTTDPSEKLEVVGNIEQSTTNGGLNKKIIKTINSPINGTRYDVGISLSTYTGFSGMVNALYEDNNGDANNRSMLAHIGGYGAGGGQSINYLSRPNGTAIELRFSGGKLQVKQGVPNQYH